MSEGNHSSTKLMTGIVVAVVGLVSAAGIVFANRSSHPVNISLQPGINTPRPALAAHISYRGKSGKNALDLLKTQVHVSTRQSSYGEYVDSIDGVQSGSDGKYWAMYVNGRQVPVAANSYITHDGDDIEWKFE